MKTKKKPAKLPAHLAGVDDQSGEPTPMCGPGTGFWRAQTKPVKRRKRKAKR